VSVLASVREGARRVARAARFVQIGEARLAALANELFATAAPPGVADPAHHRLGSDSETLAYVVTLDAINFGSGWFPRLRKRPGRSGYFTIAASLREHFEANGAFSAADLAKLETPDVARMLHQGPEVAELMALFAQALRDLGALLERRYAGDFGALIAAAGGSAERLVSLLCEMPFYRDVARYHDFEVPFYKRAQITAADLAAAFEGKGPGGFRDLGELTIFADNLVPHVLRREGVLLLDTELAARIDGQALLEPGSPQEVELRACAVHAVEQMVARLRDAGAREVSAQRLDSLLWNRGQLPAMKAHPRPRVRSVYY